MHSVFVIYNGWLTRRYLDSGGNYKHIWVIYIYRTWAWRCAYMTIMEYLEGTNFCIMFGNIIWYHPKLNISNSRNLIKCMNLYAKFMYEIVIRIDCFKPILCFWGWHKPIDARIEIILTDSQAFEYVEFAFKPIDLDFENKVIMDILVYIYFKLVKITETSKWIFNGYSWKHFPQNIQCYIHKYK